MRVIKFRAWDGEMLSNPFTIDDLNTQWSDGTYGSVDVENDKLMQFTGLLDKNGKEIYEGDIVVHPGGRVTCRVVFEAACFGFRNKQGAWEGQVRSHLDCEVIGNIYETPELMK